MASCSNGTASTLRGLETDTMLASYLLDATRSEHRLEDLALEHAGYKALARRGRLRPRRQGADVRADSRRGGGGLCRRARGPRAAARRHRCARCWSRKSSRRVYQQLEHPLIPVLDGHRARGRPDRRAGARVAVAEHRRGAQSPGARGSTSCRARSSTSTRRRSSARSCSTSSG